MRPAVLDGFGMSDLRDGGSTLKEISRCEMVVDATDAVRHSLSHSKKSQLHKEQVHQGDPDVLHSYSGCQCLNVLSMFVMLVSCVEVVR